MPYTYPTKNTSTYTNPSKSGLVNIRSVFDDAVFDTGTFDTDTTTYATKTYPTKNVSSYTYPNKS